MRGMVDEIRRPAYTGENRCWPCTAINGVLVALAAGALVAVGHQVAALAVAGLGAALVTFRGYVVPYTPAFAPRLEDWLPGDRFHSRRAHGSLSNGDDDPEAVLSTLVEAGVVDAAGGRLELSGAFRERWRDEMNALAAVDDTDLVAAVLAVAPTATDATIVEGRSRRRIVLRDGDGEEVWLSRPIAIAETAAVRALPEVVPTQIDAAAATPLRMFLEECPACAGPVEESTEKSCCGGPRDPRNGPREVLVCGDCGARLFTFEN